MPGRNPYSKAAVNLDPVIKATGRWEITKCDLQAKSKVLVVSTLIDIEGIAALANNADAIAHSFHALFQTFGQPLIAYSPSLIRCILDERELTPEAAVKDYLTARNVPTTWHLWLPWRFNCPTEG
jgi:hypothetical protein